MLKAFRLSLFLVIVFLLSTPCYAANSTPKVVTLTPSSGSSQQNAAVSFTATYTDANGYADIDSVYFLVNTNLSSYNSCYFMYSRSANKLYLMNDKGTTWIGGFAPGSRNIIENSFAKLDCSKVSIGNFGINLLVKWNITFKTVFANRAANMYMRAVDKSGANSGWRHKGSWRVKQVLSIKVEPNSWDIGSAKPNSVFTMSSIDKITLMNDGTNTENVSLSLVNPQTWSASFYPGKEIFTARVTLPLTLHSS